MSDPMEKLEEIGAFVWNSHVVYTSGKHGSAFVNLARAFNQNDLALWFAEQMAPLIEHLKFDTIVGPVNSDDKLAYAIGGEMYRRYGRRLHQVYAQRATRKVRPVGEDFDVDAIVAGKFFFPRQQEDFVRGKRVVVVADVLNSGQTLDAVSQAVWAAGGIIIAFLVGCNRGKHQLTYKGIELIEFMRVPLEAWDEDECVLCQAGVPINTRIGHGKQYLEMKSRGAGVVS